MLCHKCCENIATGEAMTQVPVGLSTHWWYFHPECFATWDEEQQKQEARIRNIARMAGHTH